MPVLVFHDETRVTLGDVVLRTGDLLEILVVGRRWIPGVLWVPGDEPIGPFAWRDRAGGQPALGVALAVPNEEAADAPLDDWPAVDADFRPYVTLLLRSGAVLRWLEPRRNIYLGARE